MPYSTVLKPAQLIVLPRNLQNRQVNGVFRARAWQFVKQSKDQINHNSNNYEEH